MGMTIRGGLKGIAWGIAIASMFWGGAVWLWSPGSWLVPGLVVTGAYGCFCMMQLGVRDRMTRYLGWLFPLLSFVAGLAVTLAGGERYVVVGVDLAGIVFGCLWAWDHRSDGTETVSPVRIEPRVTRPTGGAVEIPLGIRAFQVEQAEWPPRPVEPNMVDPAASPDLVAGVEEAVETLSGLSRDGALPETRSLHKVIRDGLLAGGMAGGVSDHYATELVPLVRNWRDTHDADWRGKLEMAEQGAEGWRDIALRMRRERDESRNLASIKIPGPVSRETLEKVRDAFETAPSGPLTVIPDDEMNEFAVEVLAATSIAAGMSALAERVTPELLSLPIPTEARMILEALADLARDGKMEDGA